MLINAKTIHEPENRQRLRLIFNSARVQDTANIGRAFAAVVAQPDAVECPSGRTLRIGIVADHRDGKTVFVQGILGAFADKDLIEMKPPEDRVYGGPQSLWRTRDGLWLRHCDAGYDTPTNSLSSYWNNDLDTKGSAFTDIVEHPQHDKNNTLFDCIVRIRRMHISERRIEIIATNTLTGSPGFGQFLHEAAAWRAPDRVTP